MGLREIQEMEAKKQEARKAAERERERTRAATTAHSPSLAQEEQTTMMQPFRMTKKQATQT